MKQPCSCNMSLMANLHYNSNGLFTLFGPIQTIDPHTNPQSQTKNVNNCDYLMISNDYRCEIFSCESCCRLMPNQNNSFEKPSHWILCGIGFLVPFFFLFSLLILCLVFFKIYVKICAQSWSCISLVLLYQKCADIRLSKFVSDEISWKTASDSFTSDFSLYNS